MAKKTNEAFRTVKKYQNRKLYDTSESCYITLDDIANLVQKGEEVKVIDNKTKNDVTSIIFAQILVEQEKSAKSNLPTTLLRDMIRRGKGSISDFMHRYVVLGNNSDETTRNEAESYVNQLIAQGELTKSEGKSLIKDVVNQDPIQAEFDSHLGAQVTNSVKQHSNLSNIEDHIEALQTKIQTLETKLSNYER